MLENPIGFLVPKGVSLPILSDLPAEISYFYVYIPENPKVMNPKPIIAHALTFKDNPKLKQLMEKYLEDTGYAPPNATKYYFALQSGLKLDPQFTIRDLEKFLARDSVEGLLLQPKFSTENPDDQDQYIDECSVLDYYSKQKEYGKRKTFWLRMEVTLHGCHNTEIIYIELDLYDTKDSLLNKLFKQLSQQFGLKDLDMSRVLETTYISSPGTKPQNLLMNARIFNQKLYNESIVMVKLSNPKKEQFIRINVPKYNSWMVIYKENETEPIKVKYDDISNLTIADLYRSKLQLKESEKRRDVVYCLKIMDNIYKPQEKVNSAEVYFKNKDNNKPLFVVAKVVNDKMIFYNSIPALAAEKNREFKLKEITIPPYQKQRREECERTIRLRAEKASHEYFKNIENVEPIVIYTSELMYSDPFEKRDLIIYQSLNKYLRETPILSLQRQSFDREWRLRYASTLLKHLEKTKLYEGITWRGVSYDPWLSEKDIGTILTFKQFTSTSIKQEVAIKFAKMYGAKAPYHMFTFKVKTGRQIIEYSRYRQGEILLQPYTEFELIGVVNEKLDYSNFKVYYLQERITSKFLPGIVANFVIWIDPSFNEGKQIFSKVQLPAETTVFEQLKSTYELEGWIGRHKDLFTDKSANLIFITNMTRQENYGVNQYAGIDAAKIIRQYTKTAPIFFYIGNIETAKKKLADKKMNMDKVFVGNAPKEVLDYLEKNIAGSI